VNAAGQRFLLLRVDVSLPDKATESGLNMRARTAEAIVEIEVPEGRVEVVAPEKANHAAAKPDAFRIACRTGQDAGSLGNLVDLFLAFLDRIGGRLLGFGRFTIAALRIGRGSNDTQGAGAAKHGKKLTQLEWKTHCPRRMLLYLPHAVPDVCLQPDWDANTAVFSLMNLPRVPTARINLNSKFQDVFQDLASTRSLCPA
jgi:hypothetical protein